jgi:hypothetical protein
VEGAFSGFRRILPKSWKIAECGKIKPRISARELFSRNIFSGGGDKTITGPLGAAERLTGRLGVKRTPRARGFAYQDQRVFAPHLSA